MRILITGSNGLIGTALKKALNDASIRYDVVERASTTSDSIEIREQEANGTTTYRVPWPSALSQVPYDQYSAVVHLALARPDPNQPLDEAIKNHTLPLQQIIDGISRSPSTCSLLFISSQSSSPAALSVYGQGKWACEQLLLNSTITWTILRPGLIVGSSLKGLFGAIMGLIKLSPIIPTPVGNQMQVQPVLLDDIIAACTKIVAQPHHHARACYDLALPSQSLTSFTQELCDALQLKRMVIPIPWRLISGLLRIAEFLPITLPVSRANLEGLLASRHMNSHESTTALNLTLRTWTEAFCASSSESSREARFLFKTIFGSEPPMEVIERYNAAQRPSLVNGTWINVEEIIKRRLDAEAVEFASRRHKTILSQKMHSMCYVAEASPSLLSNFINTRSSRLGAFAKLGIEGVRSAWKLAYGTYLLKRFKLFTRLSHD